MKSVKIGNQEWSTNNLCVTHFRNGDPIKEAKTSKEWIDAWRNKEPAWCYLDNNSEIKNFFNKAKKFWSGN